MVYQCFSKLRNGSLYANYLNVFFFQDDGILVIPSTPDFPHKLKGKKKMPMEYQDRAFSLLSIASMSGCCQVELLDNVSFQIFSFRFFIVSLFMMYVVSGYHSTWRT